jgi:type I restriction enzyme R subunit
MQDHGLFQAICRTNRTYAETKTHGLIVDYLGVFDDVAQALQFDDLSVRQAVKNFEELKRKLPELVQKCLGHFPGVDRTVTGFEGLMAAQECLPRIVVLRSVFFDRAEFLRDIAVRSAVRLVAL